ncbi:MAG: hypothetical protein ABSF67_16575 [Roseiarcus sp.]|jgi:hypothetical protein
MNYQQISNVNIDRFAALSDRIVSAIAGANDAVLEADAAIKSAQAQISLSRSALQAEAQRTPDTGPRGDFEPLELDVGLGWCARVTLPQGKQRQLGNFDTELEVQEWISRRSSAWLKKYRRSGRR